MIVLSRKFPGLTIICKNCGALLKYEESDIYGKNLVYCPLCKTANEVNYDKNYNGVIENNGTKCK